MARTHLHPNRLACLAASLLLGLAAAPALADNDKVPPGDPCGDGPGQGTGNPCNGNNGNDGAQGNAGGPGQPELEPIELPANDKTGVFITQIGDTNRAQVTQNSGRSYAQVVQAGANNISVLGQGAAGTHYAAIAQSGDENTLDAAQDGSGQTVLLLAQQGDGNGTIIRQSDAGSSYSAAAVQQSGNGNRIVLVQDGSDNQARLTQDGDDNELTATQLNNGNRLGWAQFGNGLSGVAVTQTGNGNLQITQSNTGAAFAPPPSAPGG